MTLSVFITETYTFMQELAKVAATVIKIQPIFNAQNPVLLIQLTGVTQTHK